jgi:DHA2 family multidrug resistance protein
LTDEISWHWVFWLNTFLGAFVLLLLLPFAQYLPNSRQVFAAFDWIGFLIFAGAMTTLLYVLLEGPRWNWFDDPHIAAIALICLCCLAALAVWAWLRPHRSTMFNSTVFSESHFTFGFFVSFVAGFAMFGSAFLIPAFALNVLALPATDAGLLLLPSSLAVGSGLLAAGILISANNLSPLKFVPLGILLMMAAMWMMSRSTLESGADDLWQALLIRGFGLGFLFLAITLITFKSILPNQTAAGVAMFNFGRQLGGIIGISFLTTFINDRIAEIRTVLIEHIDAGSLIFQMRQTFIAETLQLRGLDPGLASGTAANIVQNTVQQQVASLSFNDAFFSLVMLFVFAVPLILFFKLGQSLIHRMKPERDR